MLTRAGRNRRCVDQGIHDAAAALSCSSSRWRKHHGADAERERGLVGRLIELPALIERTLELDPVIHKLAERFARSITRCSSVAVRCIPDRDGRLAEAERNFLHPRRSYPAGELKHGPSLSSCRHAGHHVAPNTTSWRSSSRISGSPGRGGELIVFADPESAFSRATA